MNNKKKKLNCFYSNPSPKRNCANKKAQMTYKKSLRILKAFG